MLRPRQITGGHRRHPARGAEAAPEATESLTPQAGRPLVDELDLVDSQRGLKCAICALHNLLQQRRFSDAEARLAAVHVECKSMTGMYNSAVVNRLLGNAG